MNDSLSTSVGSDIINDQMNVFLHENDIPLVVGSIKGKKTVIFRPPAEPKVYDYGTVKRVFLEFIDKMDTTENIDVDEYLRSRDL